MTLSHDRPYRMIITLALWAATSLALGQSMPVLSSVHQRMQTYVDQGDLAGVVTLVVQRDRVIHADAVGFADLEKRIPMTLDTLFSVASMTKPISAVGALILCDQGKLGLDEPISKHLPEFDQENHRLVTLRHLLTHTSGIVGNQMVTNSLADHVATLARQPLAFTPGTKWTYGPGISVAGRLTEVVAQQPYADWLQTQIFEPLQMESATFFPTATGPPPVAQIYNKAGDHLQVTDNLFLGPVESRVPNPSGGLYASANDIARFYQMLLRGGELDGKRILSSKRAAEMVHPQTADLTSGFVPGSQWGLGVGIVREPGGVTAPLHAGTFGHGGLYGTQVWADPITQTIHILLIQRLGLINADASLFRKDFHALVAQELAK